MWLHRKCPNKLRFRIHVPQMGSRDPWPKLHAKVGAGVSLVAQWLRICLPSRGHGFEPWSGKIPHAAEQLGP